MAIAAIAASRCEGLAGDAHALLLGGRVEQRLVHVMRDGAACLEPCMVNLLEARELKVPVYITKGSGEVHLQPNITSTTGHRAAFKTSQPRSHLVRLEQRRGPAVRLTSLPQAFNVTCCASSAAPAAAWTMANVENRASTDTPCPSPPALMLLRSQNPPAPGGVGFEMGEEHHGPKTASPPARGQSSEEFLVGG